MIKTLVLSALLTVSLTGCMSVSQPVPCPELPKVEQIQTKPVGYFQTEWQTYLQTFKKGLDDLSKKLIP